MDRLYALRSLAWLTLFTVIHPLVATAAPITSNTALPVHEGELIIRAQATLTRATDDSSGTARTLSVWAAPTVLVYGATDKLALFGVLPYLDKRLKLGTLGGRESRGDSGLGDDRENDSRGRLPQPLQLGSGSWDAIVGGVFTWQKLAWEFDATGSHQFNTEANSFDFGDVSRLALSFQYRISPFDLPGGVPSFLYAVAESNLIRQNKNEVDGIEDPNSGGLTWFLAPGLQFVTKRFILETAVQIPAIQDLNGEALTNDFVATAGMRANF